MPTSRPFLLLCGCAAILSPSYGCGDATADCEDAASLQARLDAATPGDVVSVGTCTFAGPLTVPAGVRLDGAGPGLTTVTVPSGERGITLVPGTTTTTAVASLTVESEGCAGIVAVGTGSVGVDGVEVRASRGVALAVQDAQVALRDVDIYGSIDAATAPTTPPPLPPFTCATSSLSTHGLVLVDVPSADLDRLDVEGFAVFGVVAIRSSTLWFDGSVSTGLGAGFEIWGGDARIERVNVSGIRHGAGAAESFGGVVAGGADVTTADLVVDANDGFGLFHDGARAAHADLSARDNGFAAVWAQGMTGFEVTGASQLEDNAFAGVVVIDSTDVLLRGATVSSTVEGLRVSGVRTVRAADGVQLVASQGTVDGLQLLSNERVGALVDLGGGSSAALALTDVSVEGTGAELGVIGQNGTLAMGWDDGVTRRGDTPANDAAFTGTLAIADAVGPPCLPPAESLSSSGISDLLGP